MREMLQSSAISSYLFIHIYETHSADSNKPFSLFHESYWEGIP